MRRLFLAFVLVLAIIACNNKRGQSVSAITYDQPVKDEFRIDTFTHEDNSSETKRNKSSQERLNSAPIHTEKHEEYDNMRGFDPASEDDMDDNGMSRYMENNDEEGWD